MLGFQFAGLPVSPLTKDSTVALTGKRKCFQDACYALESKSGEDENEFDLDLEGQGMTEEDFGGTAASSPSSSKASSTTAAELMECPKRECSKMFKDLHAIKYHLSHAHNELEEAHNKRMRERELQRKREEEEERREEEEVRRRAAEAANVKKEGTVKTEIKQEAAAVATAPVAAAPVVKKEENGHLEQAVNLVRSNGKLPAPGATPAIAAAAHHGGPPGAAVRLPQPHPHQQRTAIVRPILNSPPPGKLPPIGAPPAAAASALLRHLGPQQGAPPPPAHMSFNGVAGKGAAPAIPGPAHQPPPAKPAVKTAPSPTYSDISDEETEAPAPPGASAAPTKSSLPPAHPQPGLVIPRVPPQASSKPIMGGIKDVAAAAGGTRPSTQSIGPPLPPGFPHGHLGLGGGGGGGAGGSQQPPPPHLLGNPFSYLNASVPPPPAHGASPSSVPPAAHVASMVSAMMSAGVQPPPNIPSGRPPPQPSTSLAPRPHNPGALSSPASQMQEMMNAANKYLASTKLQELQEKAHGGGGGKTPSTAAPATFPYGANSAAAMAAAAAALALAPTSSSASLRPSGPMAPPKPGAPKPAAPPPAHFGPHHPPPTQPPPTSATNPFGFVPPSLGSVAASLPFQSE